jgi:hypothetical protein
LSAVQSRPAPSRDKIISQPPPAEIMEMARLPSTTSHLSWKLPASACRLLVCNFDDASWQLDADANVQAAHKAGISAVLEISWSGDGAHVWTFSPPSRRIRRTGTRRGAAAGGDGNTLGVWAR